MTEPERAVAAVVAAVATLTALAASAAGPPPFTPAWRAIASHRPPAPGLAPARRSGAGPTAVVSDVAGWNDPAYQPSNRSSALAVSSDAKRVAIAWLHNEPPGDPTGAPALYATTGALSDLTRFTAPVRLGVAPFPDAGRAQAHYNGAHNTPFVAADGHGGFVALGLGMNANGYAQGQSATGYAYVMSGTDATGTAWRAPALGRLRSVPLGSSLSEMSGGISPDGTLHVVGQGHLGEFQGGMGYQRFRPWAGSWDSAVLASPYRVRNGPVYFVEGAGAVGAGTAGRGAIHVAFAWNRQGTTPLFGLYYLMSPDGGVTWRNAEGRTVATPLRYGSSDAPGAIVGAGLGTGGYTGALPGVHGMAIALAPDGAPLILRPVTLASDRNRAVVMLYARVGGTWVSAPVGAPVYWNFGGTALTVNARTHMVDVVMLDPGNPKRPAQVLLYAASLASVRSGHPRWTRRVVAEAPNSHGYASSLEVAFVPNREAVFLFEPNYHNPGPVSPVLGRATLP